MNINARITEHKPTEKDVVLAALRCALRRAQLIQNEITAAGIALAGGFIETDTALALLDDVNALGLAPEIGWRDE